MVVTGLGCNAPQPTVPDHSDKVQINLTFMPEVFSKTGQLLSRSTATWTGEVTVKNGRIQSVQSSQFLRTAIVDSYTLPDSVIQQVLPTIQFTTGANPDFVTYIEKSERNDTTSETIDGTDYTVIRYLGDYGQPLQLYSYRDGALLAKTIYTWQQVTGGIRASQALTWDYSQPDVVVKTTVTMTAGNVVILTDNHNNPSTLARAPTLARAAAYCAERIGGVLLPTRLEAMTTAGSGCASAWIGFGLNVGGLVLASAALVAAPSPFTVVSYFWAVGGLIHATFGVGASCKSR